MPKSQSPSPDKIQGFILFLLFPYYPDNPEHNKMSDRKAVIKNADMGEEMQQDAVDCATQALEKYNIEKVIKVTRQIHLDSPREIDPTRHRKRKNAENQYAIAFMHARQLWVKLFLYVRPIQIPLHSLLFRDSSPISPPIIETSCVFFFFCFKRAVGRLFRCCKIDIQKTTTTVDVEEGRKVKNRTWVDAKVNAMFHFSTPHTSPTSATLDYFNFVACTGWKREKKTENKKKKPRQPWTIFYQ